MQGINLWNQLHLHRIKIVFVLLLMCFSLTCHAQKSRWARRNNPNYDDRKLSYGFLIGLHTNSYQLKYSDAYLDMDSLHSVNPSWSGGFSLGFIVNYKLTDYLDFRLTPNVAFYEHRVSYLFTDGTPDKEELVESTMVEFPILLKYKSERRGNIRMYMVGGIKPSIEASGKNKEDEAGNLQGERLLTLPWKQASVSTCIIRCSNFLRRSDSPAASPTCWATTLHLMVRRSNGSTPIRSRSTYFFNNRMTKRIALVTGATSGIGEATARLLSKNHFKLILCGRRTDRLKN